MREILLTTVTGFIVGLILLDSDCPFGPPNLAGVMGIFGICSAIWLRQDLVSESKGHT